MKVCNHCGVNKPKTEFYRKSTAKDGLFWWCRACHKENMKAKYHELAKDEAYRVRERGRMDAFWAANPDIRKRCSQEYASKNKAKLTANASKYRASKAKRTPAWLTDDDFWIIEEAHTLAALRTKLFGFQWHVDHVVPLHGELVSGLHVPHNLQVIPAWDNRSKSNRFTITT
jgi:hypothetical protein